MQTMSDATTLPQTDNARKLTRRGLDAREKILKAMVTCIGRAGFSATTVEQVMAETGLSRGSVLHQFRNRIELAVATADYVMQWALRDSHTRMQRIADPYQRLAGYAEVMWETQSQPEGIALIEILLATRWDGELAEALHPITSWVEREVEIELRDLATNAGLPDPEAFVPQGWLLLASVRGLLIEFSMGTRRPMIVQAREAMFTKHRQLCANLAQRQG